MTALLQALAIAVGGILSPGSILLALLLLSAAGGLKKALAYYAGYFGTYLIMGTSMVLIASGVRTGPASGGPSWFYVALGCLLLFFAARTWRSPKDAAPKRPKLFETIDQVAPLKLTGLGALIACINVKNLSIFLSAIGVLVDARLPRVEAVVAAAAVAFVFCAAVSGPILLFLAGGRHATPLLARLKASLERNTRAVTLAVLTIIGTGMLVRGVVGLVG